MSKQRESFDRGRIELVADPAWIQDVREEARRLGLNLSEYIRLAVNERMRRARVEERENGRGR